MVWTPRKTWIPTDDVLETYLNEQVKDNTLWMYERYYEAKEVVANSPNETDATDYSGAGLVGKNLVTFTDIDVLEETTFEIIYTEVFSNTVAKNAAIEPILSFNGGAEYWLTTGTTTKPAFGLGVCDFRMGAGAVTNPLFRKRLTLAVGLWSIRLAWFPTAATGTLTRYSANTLGFGIIRTLY